MYGPQGELVSGRIGIMALRAKWYYEPQGELVQGEMVLCPSGRIGPGRIGITSPNLLAAYPKGVQGQWQFEISSGDL